MKATPQNARTLAIKVLSRVEATDAYLNRVLDTQLSEAGSLDARDAGLLTELCYGATRRRLTLDFAIARHLTRPLDDLEHRVLAALRLGAYQMFYTRIPRRAAVGETVEALKQVGLARASGLCNAVLRKLAELTELPLPDPSERALHLSVRESHPLWLVERWIRQFGEARAAAMLEANNQAPPVVVRANQSRTTRDALLADFAHAGLAVTATAHSPVGVQLSASGKVEELYGFAEGLFQVQDEAAQLVTLYAAVPEQAKVLDACAAPGGKACHLAERNSVLACDLHENKLPRMRAEAKRLGLSERLTARAHDATTPFPEEWGEFDAVLVDAPCTGLGTLRRHPELRYRRAEVDFARLASLQATILESCQAVVAPGGLLSYAVCSVDPVEGPDQIEMFLRSHPDFTAEPPVETGGASFPQSQGYLRTLPGPEGWDGFFAARLRKLY